MGGKRRPQERVRHGKRGHETQSGRWRRGRPAGSPQVDQWPHRVPGRRPGDAADGQCRAV